MKVLDVVGTGIVAAKRVIKAAVRPAPTSSSLEAQEELRRRARVNAEAASLRAEREAQLFGEGRWLRRMPGWLRRF